MAIYICERSDNKSTEIITSQLRLAYGNEGCAAAESNDRVGCLHFNKLWLDLTRERVSQSGEPVIDFELGTCYNEVGVAYALNNMYDRAEQYFLDSIKVYKSIEGFKDTDLGWPEPNLGLIYWVQGRSQEAELVLREMLEIHAAEFGYDDTQSFK